MFCGNCGVKNTEDSRYCIACGNQMESTTAVLETAAALSVETRPSSVHPAVPVDTKQQPDSTTERKDGHLWRNHKGKWITAGTGLVLVILIAVFFKPLMGLTFYGLSKTTSAASAIEYAQKAIEYDKRDLYTSYLSGLYIEAGNGLIESDPALAIDQFDKAAVYGANDAIADGLAKAYLARAKKSLESNIDDAIKYATQSFKNKAGDENKSFLGSAYLKKADGLAATDPKEAMLIIKDAREFASEQDLKPIINKAGEKIVHDANKDMKILKLLVQDLDNDGTDEMVAVVQKGDFDSLGVQLFKLENNEFVMTGKDSMTMNGFISAEIKPLLKDKPATIIVRALREGSDDPADEVALFSIKNGALISQGIAYIDGDSTLETIDTNNDGHLELMSSLKINDTQKHIVEHHYKWESEKIVYDSSSIKYTEGDFKYPTDPELVVKSFLDAIVINAEMELTAMSYSGDRSALTFGSLNINRDSFIAYDTIQFKSVIDNSQDYMVNENEKVYYVDYNSGYDSDSIYVVLAQENGQWKVYALSK